MATAEEVATRLAFEFLRMGRYSASTGPVEVPDLARAVAVAAPDYEEIAVFADRVSEFSGLSVQSVGFEEGRDNPKVHIYLTRGSAREIRALPSEIDDVPVLAHKMGAISIRPEAASAATNRGNIFERNGRICCGTSCGPTSEGSSGTLGAIVTLGQGHDLFLLSNNHVFAGCNHVPHNQPILAPSSHDGRPDARAPHEVGRHYAISPLTSGDPFFVVPSNGDMALARASDPDAISSWQGDEHSGYDTPTDLIEPLSLMGVKKTGRTTGLTFGVVEARVTTPMPVTYSAKHFKGVVWFQDVWTIRASKTQPFALPGDSGSLVVSADGTRSLGLVFAASPTGEYAWMIPLSAIRGAFANLNLVSGHGV